MAQHRFEKKVVIVTGSSSGIGQDAAVEFAKEGANVVITGQNEKRLNETEKLILDAGIPAERILKIVGSLEHREMAGRIVGETVKKFGRIDVLVNNAGAGGKPGISEDRYNVDNLEYIFGVNFRSIVELSLLALPHLKKTKGNVLNISSVLGVRIQPPALFYASMKAALDHWTRGFAQIAAPEVRVNSLNPGPIDTPIFERNNFTDEQVNAYAASTLLGRLGKTEEMSKIIKFLCSEDASFIDGAIVLGDGGMALKR